MEETRHPTHRRYRWWSGMLKGAVAGASPTGPWTDRRTGVRTPDHDKRQPWRIPLDRPCLLPYLTQKLFIGSNRRSCFIADHCNLLSHPVLSLSLSLSHCPTVLGIDVRCCDPNANVAGVLSRVPFFICVARRIQRRHARVRVGTGHRVQRRPKCV